MSSLWWLFLRTIIVFDGHPKRDQFSLYLGMNFKCIAFFTSYFRNITAIMSLLKMKESIGHRHDDPFLRRRHKNPSLFFIYLSKSFLFFLFSWNIIHNFCVAALREFCSRSHVIHMRRLKSLREAFLFLLCLSYFLWFRAIMVLPPIVAHLPV